MGMFDQGIVKAHERQKRGILKEAEKAGCTVLNIYQHPEEGDAGERAMRRGLTSAAKSLFGGSLTMDALQILELETRGVRHVFVQPYSGISPLPGEHHVVLPGSVAGPVVLTKGGFLRRNKWESPLEAIARAFNGSDSLKRVAKKCKWDWPLGTSRIDLDWTVQVRSLGDGHAQVVLRNGRYGGLTTYGVGFAHLLALTDSVPRLLTESSAPLQPFLRPTTFEELALGILARKLAPHSEPEEHGPGIGTTRYSNYDFPRP